MVLTWIKNCSKWPKNIALALWLAWFWFVSISSMPQTRQIQRYLKLPKWNQNAWEEADWHTNIHFSFIYIDKNYIQKNISHLYQNSSLRDIWHLLSHLRFVSCILFVIWYPCEKPKVMRLIYLIKINLQNILK